LFDEAGCVSLGVDPAGGGDLGDALPPRPERATERDPGHQRTVSLLQCVMPAHTAAFAEHPIGGSMDGQIRYADEVNRFRFVVGVGAYATVMAKPVAMAVVVVPEAVGSSCVVTGAVESTGYLAVSEWGTVNLAALALTYMRVCGPVLREDFIPTINDVLARTCNIWIPALHQVSADGTPSDHYWDALGEQIDRWVAGDKQKEGETDD